MPTSTDITPLTGEAALVEILRQRAKVLAAQLTTKLETRRYAELLAGLDGSDHVTVASAGRASGVTKGYATGLVHKLARGQLDAPVEQFEDDIAALRAEANRLARRLR
jgi:hypothetical protein